MNIIRLLIVDDETSARRRIRRLLANEPALEIVGECDNGQEAVSAVQELKPDVLLLDIQMPQMDGFQVIQALGDSLPYVIFVTAFNEYAVRAFEVFALDYILKPFDEERLTRAISRARDEIEKDRALPLGEGMSALLDELKKGPPKFMDRLVVREEGRSLVVACKDVDWLEAEGKHVRLHIGKQSHLMRSAIGFLGTQLDPERFLRVHRGAIVNIDQIRELEPCFHGEYRIVLKNGIKVTLSRTYRENLSHALGRQF